MSCLFSTKQANILESSKVKHLLLFFWFCLVCDANGLPVYTNGEALSSNTDTAPYFVGEEVSYTCNDGYVLDSSDDTFKCTCTASSSGCNPSWQCNPEETETTCRLRKSLWSVWQFVCFFFLGLAHRVKHRFYNNSDSMILVQRPPWLRCCSLGQGGII